MTGPNAKLKNLVRVRCSFHTPDGERVHCTLFPTTPTRGYLLVECCYDIKDGCAGCRLKCAARCIRYPDKVCTGCPCSGEGS